MIIYEASRSAHSGKPQMTECLFNLPIIWTALVIFSPIALCSLIAISMVHSDNRLTCGIALTLFSTGIPLSVLLMVYCRPFSGAVGPELLQQVITSKANDRSSR